MYPKGSFALGSGDLHADVDFLVATHRRLDGMQEAAVRDLHRALTVDGLAAATLIDDVPPLVLRHSAAALARARLRDIAAEPDYLHNGWGQPHEVLTRCRLLFTATRGEVTGKAEAAQWCKGVVPEEWHDHIDRAVADRPNPTQRVHQRADPVLAARTRAFAELLAPLIARAASEDDPNTRP